jgi:signal transduction histidine kinase
MQDERLDGESMKQAIETIDRNARAQAQLIEDLLDVSRIISGKLRLNMRKVNVGAVVEAAVDAVRPAAEARDIHLTQRVEAAVGPVLGDPTRLQQVVWNLLSNAIKFTPRHGEVRIEVGIVDSFVQLAVSDTGKGISKEFLPHVFDRFSQADSSSTRKYGGLGLGLAIVKHMVDLHHGNIRVESKVGVGTTVTLELPAPSVAAAAT